MNKCNAIMGTCNFFFRKNFKTKSKYKSIVFCRNPKNSNNYEGNTSKILCPKLNPNKDYSVKNIDDEVGKLIW